MRYFKILCVVLLASLLIACHQISSGTVVDKYIDEPHTTFIPVMTGKSSVLVPTRTRGNAIKYLLRFQKKNGLEDLKKARKNLDWLIEEVEKELNNDQ